MNKRYTIKNPSIHGNARDMILEIQKTGCHECTSHCLNKDGYVQVMIKGKKMLLHRYIALLEYGDLGDLYVLHSCDNPTCSNLDHLFLGTHTDNMQDMHKKGRHGRSSKITSAQAMEIFKDSRTQEVIAQEYGITQTTVSRIKIKKRWADIH